jgi:hypothetical protein
MRFDRAVRRRQAEARSLTDRFGREKGREKLLQMILQNSRSRVPDHNHDPFAVGALLPEYGECAPVGHGLNGVLLDVDQGFHNAFVIQPDITIRDFER